MRSCLVRWPRWCGLVLLGLPLAAPAQAPRGVRLADLTWLEAERRLDSTTVVVVPLGAEAKEHGPHLSLRNDWLLAEWQVRRLLERADVVVAPTINYHFYPAFVEYPGSTTLRLETARDLVVDICRSLARHGPRRFYVLNTGVSTVRALGPARDSLRASGILMEFTAGGRRADSVEAALREQPGGTHADEFETSLMLHMFPETVRMALAVRDYHPGRSPLARDSVTAVREGRTWSRSGIFGDATLATRAKGQAVAEALTLDILESIEALRRAPLPPVAASPVRR